MAVQKPPQIGSLCRHSKLARTTTTFVHKRKRKASAEGQHEFVKGLDVARMTLFKLGRDGMLENWDELEAIRL